MSEQQLKPRGGRPRLPPPPTNAADCRNLIAQEVVKTKPSEYRLRHLHRLLKAFERGEEYEVAERKNRLLAEANELRKAELEIKRTEYQRRHELGQETKKQLALKGVA